MPMKASMWKTYLATFIQAAIATAVGVVVLVNCGGDGDSGA